MDLYFRHSSQCFFVTPSSIVWFYWEFKKGTVPQFAYIYNTLQLVWVFFCTNHTFFSTILIRPPPPPSLFFRICPANVNTIELHSFILCWTRLLWISWICQTHQSARPVHERVLWNLWIMHFLFEILVKYMSDICVFFYVWIHWAICIFRFKFTKGK